jgi:hypothetical protein
MAPSSCPAGSERPDFKAVTSVPEVLSPAVALGAVSVTGPNTSNGRFLGLVPASARGSGDRLAGTRLRV